MDNHRPAFTPNPLLGSLIGLAPVIAVADGLARGLGLGLGIFLAALVAGGLSHLFEDSVPERLKSVLAFSGSAAFTAFYGLGLAAWFPDLAASLGIFIPLIAINGLIIHAIELSRRHDSAGLLLLSALGYLGVIIVVAAIREIAGTGCLSLPLPGSVVQRIVLLPVAPLRFLLTPAGAFILVGLLAAVWRAGLTAAGRIHR